MTRSVACAALGMMLVAGACVASGAADPAPGPPPPQQPPAPAKQPAPAKPPAPTPAKQPAPAPTPTPTLTPDHPVGAIALPCTVRAEVDAVVTGDEIRLRFVLMNLGEEEARVTLKTRCPGGPVTLGGLPAGFDPMHTCRAGACPRPEALATYTIPGGRKTVVLGETTLRARGDACNKPLPFGSTFLEANIVTEPAQWEVCSGAQVHVVRDHATGKLRRASLLDPPVPAVLPPKQPVKQPAPAPPKTKPAPAPPRARPCPVCGFGCTNGGVPSRRRDANGCPICACDDPFKP